LELREMKTLEIRWQRLVDEAGRTCERCGATGQSVRAAARQLGESLEPLGIGVRLIQDPVGPAAFSADPSQSNRIWIAARALEQWLGAGVASSPCCTVCGEAECRTLELGGRVYEDVPAELIVSAGLRAAAEMLASDACCRDQGGAACRGD